MGRENFLSPSCSLNKAHVSCWLLCVSFKVPVKTWLEETDRENILLFVMYLMFLLSFLLDVCFCYISPLKINVFFYDQKVKFVQC